jgi:hypothetical protein
VIHVVPEGTLEHSATYYWRVRHQDNNLNWSSWSTETRFTTSDTPESEPPPEGPEVQVIRSGADITYGLVTLDGCTSVSRSNKRPEYTDPLPNGVSRIGLFWNVITTATYSNDVTVGIPYSDQYTGDESALRLYHWQNNSWDNVTTWVDTDNNIVYGQVSGLSPFFVGRVGAVGGGGMSAVPLFPNWYATMAAVLMAGGLGFLIWRRRFAHQPA